jgi:preprotein translocase subunit SecF
MGPTLFANSNFDFVGKRYVLLGVSGAFIALCLFSIFAKKLNLGVEFTGGAQIEVNFDERKTAKEAITITSVRAALDEAGIGNAQVVTIGGDDEHAFLVRVQSLASSSADLGKRIEGVLRAKYTDDKIDYFDFDEESLDRAIVRIADANVQAAEVKALLSAAPELGGLGVEDVTLDKGAGSMVIRLENAANDVLVALKAKFGDGFDASIDSIGAAVSKDLQGTALRAIALACLLIGVYVWLRFDWDFAPGVVLALAHDALVVVGIWSIFGKWLAVGGFEFNLTIVAAVLAIIGYSVNDTVVIYDRIRENKEKHQGKDILWIVNKSVNETMSRTVLTSGATLLSVLSIALLGSESIRWFGWAMVVGILSGTWSTIAVAVPVTIIVYMLKDKSLNGAPAEPNVRAKA